jgi:hypothetical protein
MILLHSIHGRGLFLSVLFNVRSARLFGVVSGMGCVTPCGVCVVCGLFVLSALLVLSRFPMMASGLRVVLCRALMVFDCFLRHVMNPTVYGAPT